MNVNMIREHWDTLQPRERLVLIVAGVAIVALLIDTLFWTPYFDEKSRLEQRMTTLQADLSWTDGQVGACAVFTNKKKAKKYADGTEITTMRVEHIISPQTTGQDNHGKAKGSSRF